MTISETIKNLDNLHTKILKDPFAEKVSEKEIIALIEYRTYFQQLQSLQVENAELQCEIQAMNVTMGLLEKETKLNTIDFVMGQLQEEIDENGTRYVLSRMNERINNLKENIQEGFEDELEYE